MDDTEFEAALAAAFQEPAAGAVHREMTESVLQRVASNGWARAGVLIGAGLIGVAIAASALVATELARPIGGWIWRTIEDLRFEGYPTDASPFVAIGLVLMGLTIFRNAIRDL